MPLSPAHFIRSFLTLGIAQLLTWVGGAAMAIFLPRYLGDVNLGKIAFALAFTALVGLIADVGTATFLTKEVARSPERALSLTINTLVMRLGLGAVAVVVGYFAVNLTTQDEVSRQIVYVMCAGIVLVALSNACIAALQGLQRIQSLALFSIVTRLGYAALALLVLFAGAGPLQVAVTWVASQALGLVVVAVSLARVIPISSRIKPDLSVARLLFLGGLPFFMWQAALLIYGQVDAVLLSWLTQDAVVGWYAAAYRIVTIPLFLPTIVMTIIFPALSATSDKPYQFTTIARRAVHLVLLSSLPLVTGIMLLCDKIISFIGYPEEFTHSVIPMMLLAPHIVLVGVNMVVGTVLQTRERQRSWALAAVFAAVLNPMLNVPGIMYTQATLGNGAIGASIVTTLTELFMLGAGLFLLPKDVFGKATIRDASRCMAAALLMAVAVLMTRELPILAVVVIGGVVYVLGAFLSRAVSTGDVQQVIEHLLRRQTPEPMRAPDLSASPS